MASTAKKDDFGGAEQIGKFLKSREGKAIERQVMRGVFGLLRKKL